MNLLKVTEKSDMEASSDMRPDTCSMFALGPCGEDRAPSLSMRPSPNPTGVSRGTDPAADTVPPSGGPGPSTTSAGTSMCPALSSEPGTLRGPSSKAQHSNQVGGALHFWDSSSLVRASQDLPASQGPSSMPPTAFFLPPEQACPPVLGACSYTHATASGPLRVSAPSLYPCACLCLTAANLCVSAVHTCPHTDSEGLGSGSRDVEDAPDSCLRSDGDKERRHWVSVLTWAVAASPSEQTTQNSRGAPGLRVTGARWESQAGRWHRSPHPVLGGR